MTQSEFNNLIENNPNYKTYNSLTLSKKLDITEQEVKNFRYGYKSNQGIKKIDNIETPEPIKDETTYQDNGDTINISITTNRILSAEQIIEEYKIDTTKYSLGQFWVKTNQNARVAYSVRIDKRKQINSVDIVNITDTFVSPKIELLFPDKKEDDFMMEVFLTDFHLAKKSIDKKETLESRAEYYTKAINKIADKVTSLNIKPKQIVFIIGSDFFHQDNTTGSTTKLTPQDALGTMTEEFEVGLKLMIESITALKMLCSEMKVITVNGNHDYLSSFYLGQCLNAYFRNENIEFSIEPKNRKCITYGVTTIMYEHGDVRDIKKLIPVFSQEFPNEYCNAKYREIHTGDKHFLKVEELGVRMVQFPTLSVGADRWHDKNMYILNIPSAIINFYSLTEGKSIELEIRM
jgi:hypothetical protein